MPYVGKSMDRRRNARIAAEMSRLVQQGHQERCAGRMAAEFARCSCEPPYPLTPPEALTKGGEEKR